MKKLSFLFLVVVMFGATGCGTHIRVTPLGGMSYQRTQPQQERGVAYSVVVDNQTAIKATLIVDGDIRRSIPASIVTKYGMDCRGRFFIVKFPDGKSFNRKIFAGGDEMITITISESRSGKRVQFEKILSGQGQKFWPRSRDRDYRDQYRHRDRYYRDRHRRW